MPSHKGKSAVENGNVKGIDIKPLGEYVDDRVELIRQAFGCLKPKTIKNITPEFLKVGKYYELFIVLFKSCSAYVFILLG